jgi:hypothetical protein
VTSDIAGPVADKPALFGVVGLLRNPGIGGALGVVDDGRRRRRVMLSRCISFTATDGSSIRVTAFSETGDDRYEAVRSGAPMNTYLATPAGREMLTASRDSGTPLKPPGVAWTATTIDIDGHPAAFEVCDLGGGFWAAVGRAAGVILTLDSRAVPVSAVALEPVDEHPVPALPDLGERTAGVSWALDERFARVPFRRVRGRSDYWALRAVEVDHIRSVAFGLQCSDADRQGLEAHWLGRIDRQLAGANERFRSRDAEVMLNSRVARRLRRHNALFQVWSNTIGPGARRWFGNRYGPIRHHTIRLRWRP